MVPLAVLLVVTAAARVVGLLAIAALDSWTAAVTTGLVAMFVLTGTAHFIQPKRDGLIAIVPPRLPRPAALVTLTGLLELAGVVGLVIPMTRALAAACLGLLLVLLFPANVYAAAEQRHAAAPTTPLGLRTIYQFIFIAATFVVFTGALHA